MKRNKGFTLVELLVVLGILALLLSIIIPAVTNQNNQPPITGEVVDKEQKIDINGYTVYRVTIQNQTGEKYELDSRGVHNQIVLHNWYKVILNRNSYITSIESVLAPPSPGRIENGEIKY